MKDNKIKTAEEKSLEKLAEILKSAGVRHYLNVNDSGYSQIERDIVSALTPKKEYNGLPSDEEINDYGWKWSDSNNGHGPDKYFSGCNFVCGAKWMRDEASSEIAALKAEIAELKKKYESKT